MVPHPTPPQDPEPLHVNSTCCLDHGLCLYCSDTGHLLPDCPSLPPPRGRRGTMTSRSLSAQGGRGTETKPSPRTTPGVNVFPAVLSTHPFVIPVTLCAGDHLFPIPALVDLGAVGNFISLNLLMGLQLATQRLEALSRPWTDIRWGTA